jgi:hypothetical protein
MDFERGPMLGVLTLNAVRDTQVGDAPFVAGVEYFSGLEAGGG